MEPKQMNYTVEQVVIGVSPRWRLVIWFDADILRKFCIYTWWEKPSSEQIESMVDFCFGSIACYKSAANITGQLKVNKVFDVQDNN